MSTYRVIAGLVALWAFVPQVGAEKPTPATEPSAPVAVEPVTAPAAAVAAEPVEAAANTDTTANAATAAAAADDPVVCKRFEATGTRLRKGKVCKKKSVWDQQEDRAEDIIKGIERNASTGVADL